MAIDIKAEPLVIIVSYSFGLIVVITFIGTQMELSEDGHELSSSLCDLEEENEISNTDTAVMVCHLSSSSCYHPP